MLCIIEAAAKTVFAKAKSYPKENPAGSQLGTKRKWYVIAVALELGTQLKL
jgi:hypothetical protein